MITFLVAATPDVDRFYSIFQSLGERFVMVRCDRAGGPEAALAAMRQNRIEARRELKSAVHSLLGVLPRIEPVLLRAIEGKLAALAEFVVRARTHVQRDGYNKREIGYLPEPESPTRLAQQLCQLSKGSAVLDHRFFVLDKDYRLVCRVGMDCIPAIRLKILDYLGTRDESEVNKLPGSSRTYAEEELRLVRLISGSGTRAELSQEALDLLAAAGLS